MPSCIARYAPPASPLRSNKRKWIPRRASSRAVARPAGPAPMTATGVTSMEAMALPFFDPRDFVHPGVDRPCDPR